MARSRVVMEGEVGVYHCTSRCVRRAYLCGEDPVSGENYDHRKWWIRERIRELSALFGIEIFTYAVMSNHLHLVLRRDPDLVKTWEPQEVVRRWSLLYPKDRDSAGRALLPEPEVIAQRAGEEERVELWRERLGSISWLMRCLNEPIARRANREDECTGRFWEGRFKCQRLEDEGAVLACMAYVDLNPVRAKVAETPEESIFTGIYDRIRARQGRERLSQAPEEPTREQASMLERERVEAKRDQWLCPVEKIHARGQRREWGMDLEDYMRLVDFTGRALKLDKPGSIPLDLAPILERMQLDGENWVETVRRYGGLYYRVAGRVDKLVEAARRAGQRWFRGHASSRRVYRPA